jgi:hypothetical protein
VGDAEALGEVLGVVDVVAVGVQFGTRGRTGGGGVVVLRRGVGGVSRRVGVGLGVLGEGGEYVVLRADKGCFAVGLARGREPGIVCW